MPSNEILQNVPISFGEFIRGAREGCGLSLAAAATRLRCSKQYVHILETKPNQNPTIDTLANMAVVYGVDFKEITRLAAECSPDAEYRMTLVAPRKKGK
jgi:transcriptional regulator with XRE-family HTH domain